MSKRRRQRRRQQSTNPWLVALALAVIVGGLGIIFSIINNAQQPTATTAGAGGTIFERITPTRFVQEFQNDPEVLLIDVRTPSEFNGGHLANAININVEEIAQRLDEIPRDKKIVVYCRTGRRSAIAAQILRDAGYEVIYDLGGILDWQAAGYPVEY